MTGPFRAAEAPAAVVPELGLPVLLPVAAAVVGGAVHAARRDGDAQTV